MMLVAPSGEMDDDVFVQHWNLRHTDSEAFTPVKVNGALPSTRAWHRRLHATGEVAAHDHREPL